MSKSFYMIVTADVGATEYLLTIQHKLIHTVKLENMEIFCPMRATVFCSARNTGCNCYVIPTQYIQIFDFIQTVQ